MALKDLALAADGDLYIIMLVSSRSQKAIGLLAHKN